MRLSLAESDESFTQIESVGRWSRVGRAAYEAEREALLFDFYIFIFLTTVAPRPRNLKPGTRPGGGCLRRNRNGNRLPGPRLTQVPGYPGYDGLFAPLLAFQRRRMRRVSRLDRVPEYPGYHTLFAPLVASERWRGKQGTRRYL